MVSYVYVVLNVSVIIYCTYLYGQLDGLFG